MNSSKSSENYFFFTLKFTFSNYSIKTILAEFVQNFCGQEKALSFKSYLISAFADQGFAFDRTKLEYFFLFYMVF